MYLPLSVKKKTLPIQLKIPLCTTPQRPLLLVQKQKVTDIRLFFFYPTKNPPAILYDSIWYFIWTLWVWSVRCSFCCALRMPSFLSLIYSHSTHASRQDLSPTPFKKFSLKTWAWIVLSFLFPEDAVCLTPLALFVCSIL